jgi:hypothetical protein
MLDDLRSALRRLDRPPSRPSKALSNEVDTGSRKHDASTTAQAANRTE